MISDIVIILLLILVKGIVTACSSSLSVMDIRKAKYTSDKDDPNYERINSILESAQKYANGAGVINALLGIVIGFLIALRIFPHTVKLVSLGLNQRLISVIAAAALILAFTYFFALFSIILPKKIAQKYADKVVLKFIWVLDMLSFLLSPFIFLIDISVKIFDIFAKKDDDDEKDVSENEILMMVDTGGEEGSIDEDEKEMIKNIFDFDDKNAEEIATHRKDIVAVPIDITIEELINVVTSEKFTRIPVYEEDIDNIIGILHIKDFMNAILIKGRENFNLRDIIMEPFFVPSTKKTDSLFEEMQNKKVHMAIVADEYGGTAGIVTMEDLIEEVMGEIQDEYDGEEIPDITDVTERVTRIEGSTPLDDVAEKLDIEMPEDEFDTLGGFLIGQLDRIPDEDEKDIAVEYKGYVFRIDEIEENRIAMVTVIKQETEEEREEN
ncbi:MAG: hemolysin family protein [Clostridia bacterium]|nr:hemolysin family protein [Clostridia bacterium]